MSRGPRIACSVRLDVRVIYRKAFMEKGLGFVVRAVPDPTRNRLQYSWPFPLWTLGQRRHL